MYNTRINCEHEYIVNSGKNKLNTTCKKRIISLNTSAVVISEGFVWTQGPEAKILSSDEQDSIEKDVPRKAAALKESCNSNCILGCEKWYFEYSVASHAMLSSIRSVTMKSFIDFSVDYPGWRRFDYD